MQQEETATQPLSYEEKVASFAAAGIHTHEVHLCSIRTTVFEKFKFTSEEDAREFALALVAAARVFYEEEWLESPYNDGYTGLAKTFTNDEIVGRGWTVVVFDMFREDKWIPGLVRTGCFFNFGHRFGAHRMADPESKVFVHEGGRDCDGFSWNRVQEYPGLAEAAAGTEESFKWADGPMNYSVISREEFEAYPG